MPKPRLVILTLEDFNRPTGQSARLAALLPHLCKTFDLTLAGRGGPLPPAIAELFGKRIDLPLPPGATGRAWLLHPLGPLRLAGMKGALANLPIEDGTTVYADSVLLAAMAAPAAKGKLVAEVNGAIAEEFRLKSPRANAVFGGILCNREARGFASCSRLIAVSAGVAEYIRALAPGAANRISILGNGIDPRRFHPGVDGASLRRERGWGEAPVGIFIGTFRPWHGAHKLVEMLPHLLKRRPDFKLALVGDGPERPRVLELAERMQLRNSIDAPGAIRAEAAPAWIRAADVGLYFPDYRSDYGFLGDPIKLYEFMACGRPIATIRIKNFADSVKAAEAGIFSEPMPEAFAEAIANLLNDPKAMAEAGERGARAARERHTWDAVAQGIASVCRDVE